MKKRKRKKIPTVFEESAGGVVYRKSPDGRIEVILIGVKGGTVWALPKGHIEPDETPEITAQREVLEETGVDAEVVRKLGDVEYWFWWKDNGEKRRHHKVVHFFLMRYKGGDISKHDHEVDAVAWFPMDEAIARIEYDNERNLLIRAKEILEKEGAS